MSEIEMMLEVQARNIALHEKVERLQAVLEEIKTLVNPPNEPMGRAAHILKLTRNALSGGE